MTPDPVEIETNNPAVALNRCIGIRMWHEGVEYRQVATEEFATWRYRMADFAKHFFGAGPPHQEAVDAESARYWAERLAALQVHYSN